MNKFKSILAFLGIFCTMFVVFAPSASASAPSSKCDDWYLGWHQFSSGGCDEGFVGNVGKNALVDLDVVDNANDGRCEELQVKVWMAATGTTAVDKWKVCGNNPGWYYWIHVNRTYAFSQPVKPWKIAVRVCTTSGGTCSSWGPEVTILK